MFEFGKVDVLCLERCDCGDLKHSAVLRMSYGRQMTAADGLANVRLRQKWVTTRIRHPHISIRNEWKLSGEIVTMHQKTTQAAVIAAPVDQPQLTIQRVFDYNYNIRSAYGVAAATQFCCWAAVIVSMGRDLREPFDEAVH
jgi:hypothetical protein